MKSMRIPMALAALVATSPTTSASNEITVWFDATRQPAVKAFVEAHPEITVNTLLIPTDRHMEAAESGLAGR